MAQSEKKFKILINQKPFDVDEQFITGMQIKNLDGSPANYGVWLKSPGPTKDKEIGDNEKVDLGEPGREQFFTGSKKTIEG